VLVSLNFFAAGSYQLPMGNGIYSSISQSSVSRALNEVVKPNLNVPDIFHTWVKYPSNFQELRQLREEKNYHIINVQIICDSRMKILNVSSLFPGSVNDAYIWNNCQLEPTLRIIHNHSSGYYLLGDSGYPFRPWLKTPLNHYEPNTPEERYNHRFKHVRSLVKRCIGLSKMRFRLLKHRVLHYSPIKTSKIVNACTVLHKMCIENNNIIIIKLR
ncbi:putative nuclease HARBI1, partial [Aphis craccivora]